MASLFPTRPLPPAPQPRPGAARVRPLRVVAIAVLTALLAWAGAPRPVAAHAALEESDPATNAILATAPPEVTLRYTERLERSYSKAELYDQTGTKVAGAASRFVDDPYLMVVDLPAGLPNGTYSVLWRNLSADDGHTAQGYFAFTVGTEADVRPVVPPAATTDDGGPPEWLRAASRWLALLGLAVTVAVWPVWLLVLRPAISPAWQLGPALTRRVRRLATGALALAIAGSVVALVVQADGIGGSSGIVSGLATTLNETRYGTLWLVRVGLFLVYAAALMSVGWWWPRRRPVPLLAALVLTALLPLPFSLIAHASAQPEGRATAVAADWLHLLAASLWAGGLLVLVGALAPTLRALTPIGRREVLGRAIPRFSTLALIAWGVMGITGLYSAWLQVGNLEALRRTPYGQSLTLKLLLVVPLLALAAFNLLIVTRRLRRAREERTATAWSGRFVTAIVAESLLVVLVFLVVGLLTAQQPARETLARQAGGLTIALDADGQQGTLAITPGAAGPNTYRLTLGSGHDHSTGRDGAPVEALLRVELPERDTGQKEIVLTEAAPNVFEARGSELGIAGDWEIEAIVRQAGQADWRASVAQRLEADGGAADLPGPPPRFGTAGIGGLLLLVCGIAGIVLALQAGRSPLRKESAGLGTTALAIGAVLLLQARVEPSGTGDVALAAAPDPAAVVRGEALFAANCVACHGARGQGDGPAAAELDRAPADLTAPHALAHRDEDLAYWIANGLAGSAMPAFGDQLDDDQIRDLVAYLRDLQGDAAAARDAPGPEECRVTPRSVDALRALAATPAAVAPPGATAPVETGEPADAATVAGVTAAARELVACSNAGDPLRRLALFSDANVRAAFPDGPTEAFERMAAQTPQPAPAGEQVALLDVADVKRLPGGRVSALVRIDNPLQHTHGPVASPRAAAQQEAATLVFVQSGDRWLIDDVRR